MCTEFLTLVPVWNHFRLKTHFPNFRPHPIRPLSFHFKIWHLPLLDFTQFPLLHIKSSDPLWGRINGMALAKLRLCIWPGYIFMTMILCQGTKQRLIEITVRFQCLESQNEPNHQMSSTSEVIPNKYNTFPLRNTQKRKSHRCVAGYPFNFAYLRFLITRRLIDNSV